MRDEFGAFAKESATHSHTANLDVIESRLLLAEIVNDSNPARFAVTVEGKIIRANAFNQCAATTDLQNSRWSCAADSYLRLNNSLFRNPRAAASCTMQQDCRADTHNPRVLRLDDSARQ